MRLIGKYWIFFVIGIVPTALGGYGVDTWQWWVIMLVLNFGVESHRRFY